MLNAIRPKRKAVFTTFYSFKGGVGRTMALLNTACILAGRGRRVLMIDFDLEAPGLTNLALKNIAPNAGEPSNGLVELITDFLSDPEQSPLSDEQNRAPFFDAYVRQLEIPASLKHMDTGYLHLLPCGRIDADYTDRLYSIDFKQLYAEGVGQPLFKYLKTFLRDSDLYDYVLIDSRTGFSDEGGICTRDLADHIFVVMGLNRQNVDGTVQFLRRLEASGWQEGRLIFIASPVPVGEEELRNKRIEAARKAIEQTRFKADFSLRIPYHPRLALDEEPFLYNWSETDLFPVYIRITRVVREFANDTPQIWLQEAASAAHKRDFTQILNLLNQVRDEQVWDEPEAIINFLVFLTDSLQEDKDFSVYGNDFFGIWLDIEPQNPMVYIKHALFLIRNGEYNIARQQAEAALELALTLRDGVNVASARFALGEILRLKSLFQEALQQYDLSLRTFESYDQEYNTAVVRLAIGAIHYETGQHRQAMPFLVDAHYIFNKFADDRNAAIASSHIGDVYYALGDLHQALQVQQQALHTAQRLNQLLDIGVANLSIGRIYRERGDYQKATEAFETARAIFFDNHDLYNHALSQKAQGSVYMAQAKYDAAQTVYEMARTFFESLGSIANTFAIDGEIGKIKVFTGDEQEGLTMIEQANAMAKSLSALGALAEGCLDYASALLFINRFEQAYQYLETTWQNIEDYANATVKNNAYAVRAKLKVALGDVQGAVADAQVAVNFYREQEVHTLLAQETEELVRLGNASPGSGAEAGNL